MLSLLENNFQNRNKPERVFKTLPTLRKGRKWVGGQGGWGHKNGRVVSLKMLYTHLKVYQHDTLHAVT